MAQSERDGGTQGDASL